MSKERDPIDDGYQGDHFEGAKEAGWWARVTNRGAEVAGGTTAAAGLATGKPEVGFAAGAAIYGIGKAASWLASNEQDDHIREATKDLDEENKRLF